MVGVRNREEDKKQRKCTYNRISSRTVDCFSLLFLLLLSVVPPQKPSRTGAQWPFKKENHTPPPLARRLLFSSLRPRRRHHTNNLRYTSNTSIPPIARRPLSTRPTTLYPIMAFNSLVVARLRQRLVDDGPLVRDVVLCCFMWLLVFVVTFVDVDGAGGRAGHRETTCIDNNKKRAYKSITHGTTHGPARTTPPCSRSRPWPPSGAPGA